MTDNISYLNPIQFARQAYLKTWVERHYLIKMAIIPILVKFICYAISINYIAPQNILQLSFVMLPSYLVEGWFLAHWARTVIIDHRWPFKPSGDDVQDLTMISKRARGVLSGMVSFSLINFLIAGYFAYFFYILPENIDPDNADPRIAIVGVVMIASSFMLFRFVWGYIALALNVPISQFLKAVNKVKVTWLILASWGVCVIPAYIVMQTISAAFSGSGNVNSEGINAISEGSIIIEGIDIFVHVLLDVIKNLLSTAAIAYIIVELLKCQKKS